MIAGDDSHKAVQTLDMLGEIKMLNDSSSAITTLPSLLRAIWLSADDVPIGNLKKIIDTIRIVPLIADFRDEKAVIKGIVELAAALSGGAVDGFRVIPDDR
jgi:hypothetical protein